ncbi:stage V sporulation protein R [Halogeometricum rufum]|jgi:stage V sporulation protein R|uniref:Stage V sporulation protein R n=1 Tax=Halogeometricum rufum TaxID=553469 RepID=A0A1I6HID1_9EURY|nr:SpoVR family protein [Halogeometricum rufum]SFR54243.1 stage V sporulation protein R [Halogeometricum rufum]
MRRFRHTAQKVAGELEEPVREAGNLARKLGLEPYPVNYWVVDYDEMNQLIAYGGFQRRYPHWRWGMTYDRQQKQDQFGMGKAFEIVNNDNPSHAFLQESNSLADQKAVITHVEAHADFFSNNEWFGMFAGDTDLDAAAMLERHGESIQKYMDDPDIDREEVERFIDAVLCIEDNIDQHRTITDAATGRERVQPEDLRKRLDDMNISDDVRNQVFDEEWLDELAEAEAEAAKLDAPRRDVLAFVQAHGMRYDEEKGKAVEMESWQRDVLDILRTESYYFAAQKMTKVMNEGWAAYWESLMMGEERFAGTDEFVTYADHQSRVLGSPGLNPYKLGKELWEYIENTTNRREVADKLLRVKGVSWRNFHDVVDFETVQQLLKPDPAIDRIRSDTVDELASLPADDPRVDWEMLDRALSGDDEGDADADVDVDAYPWKLLTYEGLAERHFSLVKPQNRGFLGRIRRSELERLSRYMFDDEVYDTVEQAVADVDRTAGWDRMREIRESHNDVTFIDAFLTQEFVESNHYFTYEFTQATGEYRVASVDYEDVKKKLLLQFTNFGKPTIVVFDGNYANRGELLLGHQYNGIMLDIAQARGVLERLYDLWGRPVNLATIVKEYDEHDVEVARRRNREPTPTETGKRIRYDGEAFETYELDEEIADRIRATDVDYDTKPEEWLS